MKLERIDLYQLHRIDPQVPVEESLGALKTAQNAGKIRHVGLSEVTVPQIEQAKKVMPIVSIQNQYNITDRDSEAALNYCEKEKMGFIPWAPIGGSGSRSLSGCCKDRRSCCRSRAHRRSRISRRTWPQRNSSLVRRSGRGSRRWRGKVES